MLCCPCFPLRKKRKVQPEPVSTPERRPRRRPRRLFKKRKTGDAVIPEKDIVASQEPLAKDVPQTSRTVETTEEEVPRLETPSPLVTPDTPATSALVTLPSPEVETPTLLTGPNTTAPRAPQGEEEVPAPDPAKREMTPDPVDQLPNLAQTCYINSILQSLFALRPFCTQLLLQEEKWRREPSALLLRSFVGLLGLRGSRERDLKVAVLLQLKRCIALRNQEFQGNSQNDAQEFLSECLLGLGGIGHALKMRGVSYQCPVDTQLSFQLQHIRTCRSCGLESRREESSTFLSIQMVAQGTVHKSLERYFSEAEVEFSCEVCGGQTSGLKCSFHTLPRVLILHLKRFCPFTLTKKEAHLQLDAELQISQRTEDIMRRCRTSPQTHSTGSGHCPAALSALEGETHSEASSMAQELEAGTERQTLVRGSSTYTLTSIVSHIGEDMDHGHYISDCAEEGGLWLTFNDEVVSPTTLKAVLRARASSAYILFYTRKN
ncbi:ubiquitin carboxyl-terminal hydrolase 37-like isoform X1 [Alosa alosa]|uniref:ubiquitin carboxyl-terminal hydrolase 37-like isoform X1 n=1 Tax=Alosa alosa TaxID=278164 RepID=UPI0020150C08|nr:ubiquitin carboxyl-terminal hydrolase 37-like isoform X1 [Alosa alosa]